MRRVLRLILGQAMTAGVINRNIASSVKLPPNRKRHRPTWSSDEARRFLESARNDDDPFCAAYILVLVLGLRMGELLGLAWEDADFDGGGLALAWQLQRTCGTTALRGHQEKTKDRVVVVGPDWEGNRPIFTTGLGTPMGPRNLNRRWDARIRMASDPRITVHGARRTCGSLLVDLDVHPRVAMQILRHANFNITMEIYSQVSSAATRDALKRLGRH